MNARQARLYAHYLDFKFYNPEGRISPKDYGRIKKQRVSNRYWLDKLVAADWAYKEGAVYYLRSYDYIWDLLGCTRKVGKKIKRPHVPFYKLDPEDFDLDKKVYIKQITDALLERTASNHRRRMLYRKRRTHNLGQDREERSEFFGVRKAAKLFGFKSPATGKKYRDKYFCVIYSERKLRRATNEEYEVWRIKDKHCAEFLYEADKIAL